MSEENLENIEVWMVEVHGGEAKCFGHDKQVASLFAREQAKLGHQVALWDMMTPVDKGNNDHQKTENDGKS